MLRRPAPNAACLVPVTATRSPMPPTRRQARGRRPTWIYGRRYVRAIVEFCWTATFTQAFEQRKTWGIACEKRVFCPGSSFTIPWTVYNSVEALFIVAGVWCHHRVRVACAAA